MGRFTRVALVSAGVLALGGTVAWAAGALPVFVGSDGAITACVQNDNGNVRIIDPTSTKKDLNSCRSNETQIAFDQQGPPGPQGPPGSPIRFASVTVDCSAGQSVNQALQDNADALHLEVDINGVCTESVNVQQDNVTLKAVAPGDGIQAPSADAAAINLDAVRHAVLQGLTLTGGGAGIDAGDALFFAQDVHISGAKSGVRAGNNSVGFLGNVTIDGCQTGIDAGGAQLNVGGGSITGCTGFGVTAHDGGSVQLNGGVVVTGGWQNVVAAYGGTVQIGAATISDASNTNVFAFGGSIAVQGAGTLVTGSTFSGVEVSDGGNASIGNGAVVSGNSNGVDADNGGAVLIQDGGIVRDNDHDGVFLHGGSTLRMQDNAVVSGNGGNGLHLSDTSVASFGDNSSQLTGNGGWGIFCEGPPSVALIRGQTGNVSGNGAGDVNCQNAAP